MSSWGTEYSPYWLVVTRRTAPVFTFVILTFASATAALLASNTVPRMSPVSPAKVEIANAQLTTITRIHLGTCMPLIISFPLGRFRPRPQLKPPQNMTLSRRHVHNHSHAPVDELAGYS